MKLLLKEKSVQVTVIIAVFFIFFLWMIYPLIEPSYFSKNKEHNYFESFSALFSGFALAAVATATILQNKQLKIQRSDFQKSLKELKLQREEFEQQKKELELQRMQLQRQSFDTIFFQMIGIHNANVTRISSPNFSNLKSEGSAFFADAVDYTYRIYSDNPKSRNGVQGIEKATANIFPISEYSSPLKMLISIYKDEIYIRHRGHLSQYFRNLYHIIKFIDKTELISDSDKKQYSKILRAQFSSAEMVIIAYNALSDYGLEKLYPLIEKYRLIKNIEFSTDSVCLPDQIKESFPNNFRLDTVTSAPSAPSQR